MKFNLPVELHKREYKTFGKIWEFGKKNLAYF